MTSENPHPKCNEHDILISFNNGDIVVAGKLVGSRIQLLNEDKDFNGVDDFIRHVRPHLTSSIGFGERKYLQFSFQGHEFFYPVVNDIMKRSKKKLEHIDQVIRDNIGLIRGEPVDQPIEPVDQPIEPVELIEPAKHLTPTPVDALEDSQVLRTETKDKTFSDKYLASIVRLQVKRLGKRLSDNEDGDSKYLSELEKLLSSFSLFGLEDRNESE